MCTCGGVEHVPAQYGFLGTYIHVCLCSVVCYCFRSGHIIGPASCSC